jgi:hypothetical protein
MYCWIPTLLLSPLQIANHHTTIVLQFELLTNAMTTSKSVNFTSTLLNIKCVHHQFKRVFKNWKIDTKITLSKLNENKYKITNKTHQQKQ